MSGECSSCFDKYTFNCELGLYKLVRINFLVLLRITLKLGNAEVFCETESVNRMRSLRLRVEVQTCVK